MGVTAVVQHHVADYEVWRKAYDGFGDVQKAGGVTRQSVYRSIDDPDNVLDVDDLDATLAALQTAAASDVMEQDGVLAETLVLLVETSK
jgi:hypothetical protein